MTRIRNIALTVLAVTAAIFAVWYVGNTLYHHYHHATPHTGSYRPGSAHLQTYWPGSAH